MGNEERDWKDKYSRQLRYRQKNEYKMTIGFIRTTEGELLDWLDSQENKAGYIKRLIREDMARQKTE